MIIAIASGKGGTGKTTVSVNLAQVFDEPVQLMDCDVEEPNVHLFLKSQRTQTEVVNQLVPRVDAEKCDGCENCSEFCQFNAIAVVAGKAMVFPELCHACGGCALVCPQQAIVDVASRVGEISTGKSEHIQLTEGCLDVGISSATSLINAVKGKIHSATHVILDAPPGTACPAVATMRQVDYTVLVTEPTPFGLHDLKLAVATARQLGVPFGVVVNRHGIGDDRVHDYCRDEKIPLLLEIPDDRRVAEVYSQGKILVEALPEYRVMFERLRDQLLQMAAEKEGEILYQVIYVEND